MSTDRVDALLLAAATGEREVVGRVLAADPALARARGPHPYWGGRPDALQVAAEWGRLDIVADLLDAGADHGQSAAEYDGWSALHCAIGRGHRTVVDLLLDRGALADIWAAAMLGDIRQVRDWLRRDPRLVNARGPNDATPLHFASTEAVARALVEAGADLNATDKYGSTPLRAVAYSRRARGAASFLMGLVEEPDVFLLTATGDTRRLEILLRDKPELVMAVDDSLGPASARGGSALHIAAAMGETDAARVLLAHHADPNASSHEGHRPLHYAARNGHHAMIELLLERGADLFARDSQHAGTPSDWADFFDQEETARLLRKREGMGFGRA
jgi:ankyrin repeat protein